MAQGEGAGRPTKFTPERCAKIVHLISKRVPYQLAAEASGICEDTLYDWLVIAKEHKKSGLQTDYTKFFEDIKTAEASRVVEHLEKIAEHTDKWQGDAWILERRWYKHFGANAQLNEVNQKLDKLLSEKGE